MNKTESKDFVGRRLIIGSLVTYTIDNVMHLGVVAKITPKGVTLYQIQSEDYIKWYQERNIKSTPLNRPSVRVSLEDENFIFSNLLTDFQKEFYSITLYG